jgi:hypothetical protein
MDVLGNFTSAAMFIGRDEAEAAWDALNEAGIPATVVTDPGLLGKYSVSVEVDRKDLDRAVAVLQAHASTARQHDEDDQ